MVVTRWFGGTELGTGGLARAYREATRRALQALEVVEAVPSRTFRLRFAYEDTGPVMRVLEASGGRRLEVRHGQRTRLDVALPAAAAEEVLELLRDATGGRVEWSELEARPLLRVGR